VVAIIATTLTQPAAGLATTKTKRKARRFTTAATLPPLDRVPLQTAQPESPRDYSLPLPVVYTNDLNSVKEWVETCCYLRSSAAPTNPMILGWDMESTPWLPWREGKNLYTKNSYFGPSTLQLSTPTSALVLQIAQDGFGPIHDGGLPELLHGLLNDPNIMPTGVGIDDDMVELYRWCLDHGGGNDPVWAVPHRPILTRFDMGGIGLTEGRGRTIGLARLVAGILGLTIPKSKRLAMTRWSKRPPLSAMEITYAARDAWAGAAIMERLAALDHDRFGPEAIRKVLEEQMVDEDRPLRPIWEISKRQKLRKAVRTEWKEIGSRIKQTQLQNSVDAGGNENDVEKKRHNDLYAQLKELAPTPPISFEITKSMGLEIS